MQLGLDLDHQHAAQSRVPGEDVDPASRTVASDLDLRRDPPAGPLEASRDVAGALRVDAVPLPRLGQRCDASRMSLAPMALKSLSTVRDRDVRGDAALDPGHPRLRHTSFVRERLLWPAECLRRSRTITPANLFADCTAAFNNASLTRRLSASMSAPPCRWGMRFLSNQRGTRRLASVRRDFGHGSRSSVSLHMPRRHGRVGRSTGPSGRRSGSDRGVGTARGPGCGRGRRAGRGGSG